MYIAFCNLLFLQHYESNIHPLCGMELNFIHFSLLCRIPLCKYTTMYLSVLLAVDICVVSSQLSYILAQVYESFFPISRIGIPGSQRMLMLTCTREFQLFSKVATPFPSAVCPIDFCMSLRDLRNNQCWHHH